MAAQTLRMSEPRDEVWGELVDSRYPEIPPKVEYSLTAWGQALCPPLDSLLMWAAKRKA
jgi:DNA-binding HxlR family transcriptional regulator